MNKLDKQFEEMMKSEVKLNSPSSDFTFKVMSRVFAEATVKPRRILQDYQPVISKKAWILIISAFSLLLIYTVFSGQGEAQTGGGVISNLVGKLSAANNAGATNALKTSLGMFKSIPPIAYLIVISTLALWTLDAVLQRFRNQTSKL